MCITFIVLVSSILPRPPSQMLTLHYYGVQVEKKKLELLEWTGKKWLLAMEEISSILEYITT